MRGARGGGGDSTLGFGIIPADAGSTEEQVVRVRLFGDHPRGCGEHRGGHSQRQRQQGSSPRMRGALKNGTHGMISTGIIPADAGSTGKAATKPTGIGDHPRGCGEHCEGQGRYVSRSGSSPRMRGAPYFEIRGEIRNRIIPADAGSTARVCHESFRRWDHPRGCGEHHSHDPIS